MIRTYEEMEKKSFAVSSLCTLVTIMKINRIPISCENLKYLHHERNSPAVRPARFNVDLAINTNWQNIKI